MPSAQRILAAIKLVILFTTLIIVPGCSSRVVYEPANTSAATSVIAININTAYADELEKLPYVGRKTAESIVQFRQENGPFRQVEHIMQIRGISETRFIELRQFLKTE